MSDKSSHLDANENEDSSSFQSKMSQKNQMAQPPVEQIRRRDDEPWTLPFASPIIPQFQMQPHFQQMQNFPSFNLKQGSQIQALLDNLFEDYQDLLPQDQRRNPFRKVSAPIDMLAIHDHVHAEEEVQGAQNQNMKMTQLNAQQQYPQQQMIRFPFNQMQGVHLPHQMQGQIPSQIQQMQTQMTPQMAGQISQQIQSQMAAGQAQVHLKNPPQQQFVQYNPLIPSNMQPRYPYFQHPIYPPFQFIPSQQPQMEPQHFQNINTVSKELQTKVYMIVQQVSVSSFQCNCKKSKCLKLYCECFANGQVCSQSCNCLDCKNRIDNPQERQKAIEEALIRNNDAFNQILNGKPVPSPYVHPPPTQLDITLKPIIKDEKSVPVNTAKGQLANRIRKGCNCKKSNCKKKYCECFSANQACNDLCKCEGCYNRKDGKPDRQPDDANKKIKEEVEEEAKEKEADSGKKSQRSKKIKKEHDDKLGTFASNQKRYPA